MNTEVNFGIGPAETGVKVRLWLRLAQSVAVVGCLLRLWGDLSASSSERMVGGLIALIGFVTVLCLYLVSKIGNHRPVPPAK